MEYKNEKTGLRYGYTTGSCATGAAKAAAWMLLSGKECLAVKLKTPKGMELSLTVKEIQMAQDFVSCAIEKDSGDDADVTDGILVFCKVERIKEGIVITGGNGVGKVTKKGLEQPVGEYAINQVPRKMIAEGLKEVARAFAYAGGFLVTIFVPDGEKIAEKTFNPRLGIMGGISILGSSGIVEPMSEKALLDSIFVEMKMRYANGQRVLLLTPGNYGQAFLKRELAFDIDDAVKISNFIGDGFQMAKGLGYEKILLVGHIGKLIKLSGGIFNTHSKVADCRRELLSLWSVKSGGSLSLLEKIMQTVTTEEGLSILEQEGMLQETMQTMIEGISFYLNQREKEIAIEVLVFSNEKGILGYTKGAMVLLEEVREERKKWCNL